MLGHNFSAWAPIASILAFCAFHQDVFIRLVCFVDRWLIKFFFLFFNHHILLLHNMYFDLNKVILAREK